MDDDAAIEDTIYGRTPLIEDTIIKILKDEELQSRNIPALENLFVGLLYFCVESLIESFIGTRTWSIS